MPPFPSAVKRRNQSNLGSGVTRGPVAQTRKDRGSVTRSKLRKHSNPAPVEHLPSTSHLSTGSSVLAHASCLNPVAAGRRPALRKRPARFGNRPSTLPPVPKGRQREQPWAPAHGRPPKACSTPQGSHVATRHPRDSPAAIQVRPLRGLPPGAVPGCTPLGSG